MEVNPIQIVGGFAQPEAREIRPEANSAQLRRMIQHKIRSHGAARSKATRDVIAFLFWTHLLRVAGRATLRAINFRTLNRLPAASHRINRRGDWIDKWRLAAQVRVRSKHKAKP